MSAATPGERRVRQQIVQLKSCFDKSVISVGNGWPLDVMLSEYFAHKRELGSRDRRLLKESIYSYFRWKGWLDQVESVKDNPQRMLVLAGCIAFSERPPALQLMAEDEGMDLPIVEQADYSVVKEWIEQLAGKLLSVDDLVPAWIPPVFPSAVNEGLIPSFQVRPSAWIRCLKKNKPQVLQAFKKAGYGVNEHSENPRAVSIDKAFPETALLKACNNGFIIQDLASQVVSDVCIQLECKFWWDVCCGSGGKAFSIADAGSTHVFASDTRNKMTRAMQQRKKQLGIHNLSVASIDATKDSPRERTFDGILVDAPCSGLGTWSRNPDHRWSLEEAEIEECQKKQLELLDHTSEVLSPGGFLVYSVCTITQKETSEVAEIFLKDHPGFTLHEISHPLHTDQTSAELWVHPSEGPCSGMYVAVFKKPAA